MEPTEPTIRVHEPRVQVAYTMVPNPILEDERLSMGAKLTYAMLLKYAWYDNQVYPGQATLARQMGCTERSVRTYLHELDEVGLLAVEQRGLGRTNVYTLTAWVDRRPENISGQDRKPENISGQDRIVASGQDRKIFPPKQTKPKSDEGEVRDRFTRGRYGHVVRSRPED
jgi:hypothetical protein